MRTRNIPIRNLLVGFLTALVGLMMLAATPPTYARSTYLIEWEFYYPDSRSDNNASCALCHQTIDGSNYNPYGNAIRSQSQTLPLTTRFANVEPLNSDADPGGYTNKQEIDASTQPGWKVGDAVPTGVTGDLDPIPDPGILQFSSATYSVNENGGSVTITVTRTEGTAGNVDVTYATSDGTATAGSDYTFTTGTLTLADGVTSATFSVPIIDDTTFETNETVNLTLSSPTNGATLGTPSTAVLTIVENDPAPSAGSLQFSSATYSVNENGASVTIAVTRSGGDFGVVSVDYATSDGTASASNDYTATSGTLTLLDSQLSASFTVPILDDNDYEGDETVNLRLSNPTGGATLGTPSSAVLTIVEDDPIPSSGSLQFSSATYSVNENGVSISIGVTRTGGDFGEVTVDYTTSDGTASAGSDYTAASGTLTLADGVTIASFNVSILNDTAYEGNETVNLALSNPTGGATLGTPSGAVLTIVEDDPVPSAGSLQFSGATYSVDENGVSALITVTRIGGDFGEVTVDYTTSDGTASAGNDYTSTSGTLTLADGDQRQLQCGDSGRHHLRG
jgi:major membrane immunogen (membrane-anchored lipoprotein)/ribosomal protein L35AE/L33A